MDIHVASLNVTMRVHKPQREQSVYISPRLPSAHTKLHRCKIVSDTDECTDNGRTNTVFNVIRTGIIRLALRCERYCKFE